jgi:hypothetical protein
MLENTKLHARKGKKLAIDFDVSDATRASFGGQTNRETHDGKKLCLLQQPELLGAPNSKSSTD